MIEDNEKSIRDPRLVTTQVSAALMHKVTQVVIRDEYSPLFELVHEVYVHDRVPRLGFYRVIIMFDRAEKKSRQISHVFDLQMMLDLKGGWEAHVEERTLKMMRELLEGAEHA